MHNQPTAKRATLLLFTAYKTFREPGERMREQQSGLGNKHYVRKLPHLTQQQIIAAARKETQRQAYCEAEEEADPSYGGHLAVTHSEHRPNISTELTHSRAGTRGTSTRAPVTFDAEGDSDLEEDDSYYDTRPPTSTRRYGVSPEHIIQRGNKRYHVMVADIPARKSRQAQLPPPRERYIEEVDIPVPKGKRHVHPLLYLGVGMIVMAAFFLLLSGAAAWLHQKEDDLTYGRPRTFQIDAVVGHNDSRANPSHFIALNLNRYVEVIEIPGGDDAKEKVYDITTLFGDSGDLTPVTLSFRDLTGNGKLDMIIHIQNTDIVMVNENGTFRPAKPGEIKGIL